MPQKFLYRFLLYLAAATLGTIALQGTFLMLFSCLQWEPQKVDLIVVYPGTSSRLAAGCKLAREGCSANLAVSGYTSEQLAAAAKVYDLPPNLGLLAYNQSRSTFEDAYNTRQLVQKHQLSSVLLVTSDYHLPRAYLLTRLMLLGTGTALHPYAIIDKSFLHGENGAAGLRTKMLLAEMVKFWGSLTEMTGALATQQLMLDLPWYFRTNRNIKHTLFGSPCLPE